MYTKLMAIQPPLRSGHRSDGEGERLSSVVHAPTHDGRLRGSKKRVSDYSNRTRKSARREGSPLMYCKGAAKREPASWQLCPGRGHSRRVAPLWPGF